MEKTKITFFHIKQITEEDGYHVLDLHGLHEELEYELEILVKQNMPADPDTVIEEQGLFIRWKNDKSDAFLKTLSRKYLGIENDERKLKAGEMIDYAMILEGETKKINKDIRILGKLSTEFLNFHFEIFPKKKLASLYIETESEAEKFINYLTEK